MIRLYIKDVTGELTMTDDITSLFEGIENSTEAEILEKVYGVVPVNGHPTFFNMRNIVSVYAVKR